LSGGGSTICAGYGRLPGTLLSEMPRGGNPHLRSLTVSLPQGQPAVPSPGLLQSRS